MATERIWPDVAILQMSIRYRWEDVFWFSLFHELGHVLLHPRREVFVEWDNNRQGEAEEEADHFAMEQLIPSAAYEAFVAPYREQFNSRVVIGFAREEGIAPSIVVGRLQHDRLIPHSHLNGLRRRFEWASASDNRRT